jgi:hypothetical protein
MTVIELTNDQVSECVSLGTSRHAAKHSSFRNKNRWNSRKTSKVGRHKIAAEFEPHILGVLGEMAWSLHSSQELDRNIYEVRDDGEDFPSLEVKTLTYFGKGEPELKIPVTEFVERDKVKIYVLARVDLKRPEEVELLGQIDRAVFNILKTKKKYGQHLPTNYIVKLSEMELI